MQKKYFFFDIDGTLTDQKTHKIVPSALEAIKQLKKNGHFVSIATGRAHYKAVSFSDTIDIHDLVCAGGGCIVINDKVLENEPLDFDKAVSILEKADQNGIGWLLMLEDSDEVWMRDYRFLEQAGRRTELTTYHCDTSLDYHKLDKIFKIYLALTKEQEQKYDWLDTLGRLRLTEHYFVYQFDAKRDGILKMMKYLNADPADVVVFGDDMNDLVMFDPQWTSIAMGNAVAGLKTRADYVTARNIDDGIFKACEHFQWI